MVETKRLVERSLHNSKNFFLSILSMFLLLLTALSCTYIATQSGILAILLSITS